MTNRDENLSCLLDDHAVKNVDSAVDELVGDINLQYRMRRYRLIGETMRHQLPDTIDNDFHHRVMAQIGEELSASTVKPASADDSSRSAAIWSWVTLKPLAGMAVAATVAIVTVSLWQPTAIQPGQVDDALVLADQHKLELLANGQIQGVVVPASAQGLRWKVSKNVPGIQQKLNAYLVNHTEYSNSMQGLIPQARVAGFDAQQ
jgi:negative regulator of sigma E activity